MKKTGGFQAIHHGAIASWPFRMARTRIVNFHPRIGGNSSNRHALKDRLCTRGFDTNKLLFRNRLNDTGLLAAKEVEIGNLVYAGDGAERSAGLLGNVLAPDVFNRVILQRFSRETTLL